MIKKIIMVLLNIIIFMTLLMIFNFTRTHYTRIGTVEKQFDNDYYFYDSDGNVWEFQTDEELTPDMIIEVIMYDNHTRKDIYDDMIFDYKVVCKNKN